MWWLRQVTSQTLRCEQWTRSLSQRTDRAAPVFLQGTWHRCTCLVFSIPGTSLPDKTTSRYCQNKHFCLMWGRFWRAHLLCFIMSPMEKQTSLCFSSERYFTSGPTSSFRRSICSRVCWTKYPTAPCWDGSKAWICCKMSRTFSNQTKETDSEQVYTAVQHLHTYVALVPRPRGLPDEFSREDWEPFLQLQAPKELFTLAQPVETATGPFPFVKLPTSKEGQCWAK